MNLRNKGLSYQKAHLNLFAKKDSVWRTYRWPLIGTLLLILALLAFFVPLPYYLEMPGSSEDIRQVMRVNQKNDEAPGSYDFVTVAVKQATFSDIVYAWVTPFTDIYSEKRNDRWQFQWGIFSGSINFIWRPLKILPNTKD